MNKETQTLLRKRAILLAAEPVQTNVASQSVELISFDLANETYGIEADLIREIFQMRDFTFLPGLPNYILGVTNVRGQILPVVSLKKLFNLPEKGIGNHNKLIILKDGDMEFGILADEVNGSEIIQTNEIQAVPPTVTGDGQKYMKGVMKNKLIVIDAYKLISDGSIVVNETMSN